LAPQLLPPRPVSRCQLDSKSQEIGNFMETVMKCGSRMRRATKAPGRRRANSRGFSLIEMVIVVAISLILAGIAIPRAVEALRQYRLRSAVASLTGAIQSTRYQAIFHGCAYQLAFSS